MRRSKLKANRILSELWDTYIGELDFNESYGILSELSDTYIGDGNLRKVNVVIVRFLINNLV